MYQQNQVLRSHCLGNFSQLVLGICQSAAMLMWLDGDDNKIGRVNQNLARELMECFTVGVYDKTGKPNYTQQDVVAAARALTGWDFDHNTGVFQLISSAHDKGLKTFRGQTGNLGGEDIILGLCQDPAAARFVAFRLWNTFAYEVSLNDPVLDELESAYLTNNMELRPVVELMFTSEAFYAPKAQNAHVKNPCEWLVGSVQQLNGQFNAPADPSLHQTIDSRLGLFIQNLGQSLFNPPTVFGWKENLSWLSSDALLNRLQIGASFSFGQNLANQIFLWDPLPLLPPSQNWPAFTAQSTVTWVLKVLGVMAPSPTTVDALVTYLGTDINGQPQVFALNEKTIRTKLPSLVALILACPDYQFS